MEWSPDIYNLYFVCLCTANRPAMVCIHSMDADCAHWDIQVRWLMICWWPCHKYYITILYLKLPWYCWNYKSNLNKNIQELYIIQGSDYVSTARWSNSHNTILITNYPFDRILYLALIYVSVFLAEHQRIEQPHKETSHPDVTGPPWPYHGLSSLHHNLGMFAN